MGKGETEQKRKQVADDLEPYRRLIKIQKQLARMAKQHQQSRRECDALREQVARELAESLRVKPGMRHRLRQTASKLLKRLSRLPAWETSFRTLKNKLPFLC